MTKRSRNKKNRKAAQNGGMALQGPGSGRMTCGAQPPPFTSNLIIRKVFRFIADGGSSSTTPFILTPPKVGAILSVGTTATQIGSLFESVRIRSISIWSSVVGSAGNTNPVQPVTVSIIYSGAALGIGGSNIMHSDTSVGMTRVARVKARPDPMTQAGQWQNTSTAQTAQYFQLICGPGSIVDIDVEGAFSPVTRSGFTTTVATASVGQVYYMALDNAAGGTGSVGNHLVPPPELLTTV